MVSSLVIYRYADCIVACSAPIAILESDDSGADRRAVFGLTFRRIIPAAIHNRMMCSRMNTANPLEIFDLSLPN